MVVYQKFYYKIPKKENKEFYKKRPRMKRYIVNRIEAYYSGDALFLI